MRISDWSSDVCSSDLAARDAAVETDRGKRRRVMLEQSPHEADHRLDPVPQGRQRLRLPRLEIVARHGELPVHPAVIAELPAQDGIDRIEGVFDTDRKSVVSGKSVSVRVYLGGRRIIKQKKKNTYKHAKQQ